MIMTESLPGAAVLARENCLAINILKCNIGKAVIETYFSYFGYDVYPFGYEKHYADTARLIEGDPSTDILTKSRAVPDMLIYDRDKSESFLIEVKTSGGKNPSQYWMEQECFDNYRHQWPNTFLVVYLVPSGKICCSRITDICYYRRGFLLNRPEPGYYFNLDGFLDLPDAFCKVDRQQYNELRQQIHMVLETFDVTRRERDVSKLSAPDQN